MIRWQRGQLVQSFMSLLPHMTPWSTPKISRPCSSRLRGGRYVVYHDNHSFQIHPSLKVLVVDEGQRLKNDSSLLFKKLNELNTVHRVIMTGVCTIHSNHSLLTPILQTPLNNNIRELFNLMNFLDPGQWHDLEGLEKEYKELTEDLVKQLHNKLKPYFLRRIKSEVLQLPPKVTYFGLTVCSTHIRCVRMKSSSRFP
jgi:hypothetical protein